MSKKNTSMPFALKAAQKMYNNDKLLRAVFEHAPMTLGIIDSEQRITYVNHLTTYSEEDVIGKKPQDFMPAAERERVSAILDAVLSTGQSDEYETSFSKPDKDGNSATRTYLTRVGRIQLDDTIAAMLIVLDISAERAAQSALRKSEAQLRQAQKMEAVGQLTGGLAHDFNNLLTVILGAIDIAASKTHDQEALECLEDAREAAAKAGKLTDRLLAFSRKQALHPKAINVHILFTDLEPLFKRTIREEIDLEMHIHGVLKSCFVDSNQLENALLNLVLNARDAIRGHGRIRVCADEIEISTDSAQQKDIPKGRYTRFLVADNGEGMTPAQLTHAFEPFYTTKEVGKGSGLGLSMVYGFVKQSGGHAYIQDEPDGGTQVILLLPCYIES